MYDYDAHENRFTHNTVWHKSANSKNNYSYDLGGIERQRSLRYYKQYDEPEPMAVVGGH
jgi:hypothetical protein